MVIRSEWSRQPPKKDVWRCSCLEYSFTIQRRSYWQDSHLRWESVDIGVLTIQWWTYQNGQDTDLRETFLHHFAGKHPTTTKNWTWPYIAKKRKEKDIENLNYRREKNFKYSGIVQLVSECVWVNLSFNILEFGRPTINANQLLQNVLT